jgi:hypothetical protein
MPRAFGDTAFRKAETETSFEGSLMMVQPDESRLEAEDLGTSKEGRGMWVATEA